jgi:ATP-binding cassette subfamily C protein
LNPRQGVTQAVSRDKDITAHGDGAEALPLLEQARRQFVGGLGYAGLLTGFINVAQLTVPFFMLQLYDRVLNSHNLDTLAMLIVVAVGGLVLYGILDFIRARVFMTVAAGLVQRLNLATLQSAIARTLEGREGRAGQAMRDLAELRSFLGSSAVAVPLEAAWMPVFLIVLFLLHPLYALVALLSGILLMVLSIVSDMLSRRLLSEASDAGNDATASVSSAIRNAEVIEAMGMLRAVSRRWRDGQRRMLELLDRGNRNSKALTAAIKSTRSGMQIATLSVGAVLVLDGSASPGSMIAASLITARILLPFEQLVDGWRQWVFAGAAWRRIRELVDSDKSRRQSFVLPRPAARLEVDRLVYVPQGADRPIIKGVSFALEAGDVLAIVGPSAAGKSTLARLLVGVLPPSAGGVYLDSHNVYSWERTSFGSAVGYLPQNVALLDGTVRENIARMREADAPGVLAAARAAGVHELIGRLPYGYDTPVSGSTFLLSGGQRQRIALARALYGDPVLLVLDEPNSNLDFEGEQALIRALQDSKERGGIAIVIAHRPSLSQVADKILVLKDGRIDQFGPRTDVIKTLVPQEGGGQRAAAGGGGDVTPLTPRGR